MILVNGLSFGYPDSGRVLDGISFRAEEGERIGVIGPNGAGKTTLFQLLCGLLKADVGSMAIGGREVQPHQFNPDTGFVFQNPDDQLFNATVYEDIAFGPLNLNLPAEEREERIRNAIETAGCGALLNRPPHHLSGGEKRMVSIATIIAMKPRLMIYDEPTSNLDMRARRHLIDFINRSYETALISSHDLEFILETCSRVLLLDVGIIVADGPAHRVMNDAVLMRDHGLERPHSLLHGKGHRHPRKG